MTDSPSNPIRSFNGGFHDAQADRKAGRQKRSMASHPNPMYGIGYLYGSAYPFSDVSTPAWEDFIREMTGGTVQVEEERPGLWSFRIARGGLVYATGGFNSPEQADATAVAKLIALIEAGFIAL